jgi:hypothetical protein
MVVKKKNREDAVIADIDTLIDEQLQRGPTDDYNADWHTAKGPVICKVCGLEWHGLDNGHCPGVWATAKQKKAFKRRPPRPRPAVRHWVEAEGQRLAAQAQALRNYYASRERPPQFVDLTGRAPN